MAYTVYIAERDSGAGAYIGLTSRLLSARRREHEGDARNGKKNGCRAFAAALVKYGADAFAWNVLADGLTESEARLIERFAIDFYRPRYNIAPGGSVGNGETKKRPVICVTTGKLYHSVNDAAAAIGVTQGAIVHACAKGSVCTSEKLSFRYEDAPQVVRVRTPEQIEAGRLSRIEKLKARRHPPETIERMKGAAKKRGVARSTREAQRSANQKPVVCVETGTVFRDGTAAGLAHGIDRNRVYECIYHRRVNRAAGVSFRRALQHEVGMMNVREVA